MNGLAKASGILSIIAGVIFIVAVALGLSDGLNITADNLEAFEAVKNFKYLSLLAGLIAVFAGYAAVSYGASKKAVSDGLYGVFLTFLGVVIALSSFKADINTLTWTHMEILIVALVVVTAAAFALAAASKKLYILADVAIVLAFVAVVVYALDMKILTILVAMVVVIVLGALMFVSSKPRPEPEAEEVEGESATAPAAEEERVVVPAAAPVPAAPPVAKPAEEGADKAAAEDKAAAPAKAAAAKPAAASESEAPAKAAAAAAPAASESVASSVSSASSAGAAASAGAASAGAAAGSAAAAGGAGASSAGAAAGAAAGVVAVAAVAGAAAASEKKEEEAAEQPKEETELDRLLAKGWAVTVANVGEERANEMSDYEIMAVISIADPELYAKLSILTGIVVSTGDENEESGAMTESDEDLGLSDEDLGLIPDTPSGFVRRACWNKGLRCRKDYGPYYIPFAFVKSKVGVYIDGPTPDNRNDEALRDKSWVVLHFPEADITDGQKEAEVIYDAVKENTRALKKAKSKKKKR